MKGHVPTPRDIVDYMVLKLFAKREPTSSDIVLDAGAGTGPFIEGILRYCRARGLSRPRIIGIENDPNLASDARKNLALLNASESIICGDYLGNDFGPADFIIGNPPYVGITGLDEPEKKRYRARYESAVQRFDLYQLFLEQSIRNLKPGGRLVFITPEKFTYVHTAEKLRRILATRTSVEEIEHVSEATFGDLVTYPVITTLVATAPPSGETFVSLRDGSERRIKLPDNGTPWSAAMNGLSSSDEPGLTLGDVCVRVSAGVATGADSIWVMGQEEIERSFSGLMKFAYPTISGRQLSQPGYTEANKVVRTSDCMLIPYDRNGAILPESELNSTMKSYVRLHSSALLQRTHLKATETRSTVVPLHKFHDSVPFGDMLHAKILCKDITQEPKFWADLTGQIVPRHTAYYAVPIPGVVQFDRLLDWLNGDTARSWLRAHSQKAANGFYRLQSKVLERVPIPDEILRESTVKKKRIRQVQFA